MQRGVLNSTTMTMGAVDVMGGYTLFGETPHSSEIKLQVYGTPGLRNVNNTTHDGVTKPDLQLKQMQINKVPMRFSMVCDWL